MIWNELSGNLYNTLRLHFIGTEAICEIVDFKVTEVSGQMKSFSNEYFFDCTKVTYEVQSASPRANLIGAKVNLLYSEKINAAIPFDSKITLFNSLRMRYIGPYGLIRFLILMFFYYLLISSAIRYTKKVMLKTKILGELKNLYSSKTILNLSQFLTELIGVIIVIIICILFSILFLLYSFDIESDTTLVNGVLLNTFLAIILFTPAILFYGFNQYRKNQSHIFKVLRNLVGIVILSRVLYALGVITAKLYRRELSYDSIADLFNLIFDTFTF